MKSLEGPLILRVDGALVKSIKEHVVPLRAVACERLGGPERAADGDAAAPPMAAVNLTLGFAGKTVLDQVSMELSRSCSDVVDGTDRFR